MNTNRMVAIGLLALCLMTVAAPAASATAFADSAIIIHCRIAEGSGTISGQSVNVGPVHVNTDAVSYRYCI